jgi:hypothetical protein
MPIGHVVHRLLAIACMRTASLQPMLPDVVTQADDDRKLYMLPASKWCSTPEQMRRLVRTTWELHLAMPAGHEICVPKSPACWWWAHRPPRACPDAPADHAPPIIKRTVATWSRDDDAIADAGSPLVYGCKSRSRHNYYGDIYIYIYMQSKVWCVERVL